MRKRFLNAFIIVGLLGLGGLLIEQGYMFVAIKKTFGGEMPDRCKGRQWENPQEHLDCVYPPPPHGRWHAVYTEEFAKARDLPLDNVSEDLSPGVDYMEMDVQPYGHELKGTACLVNMLIKKPHDVALYSAKKHTARLPENRKLLHLIDLDSNKVELKPLDTFESSARAWNNDNEGYRASTLALYSEDVLPGYDYFTANKKCRDVSMHPQYYPDGYAFWVNKASVWGRYESRFIHLHQTGRPRGEEFFNSHFFINIPHELISNVFHDIPKGGK